MATTTLALLAASFLPWYRSGWARSRDGAETYETTLVNAWSASAWWSGGILLGLMAGTGMVTMILRPARTSAARPWRWAFPALALAGLTLIVWRRLTITTTSLADGAIWQSGEQANIGQVLRDQLIVYHAPGRDLDISWGFLVGVAVLLVLLCTLIAAAARQED
ncbi:MAG TPA: hypothetical protein VF755_18820 [Catenuloplanes sp.]